MQTNLIRNSKLTNRQLIHLANMPINCGVMQAVRAYVLWGKPAPQIPASRLSGYVQSFFQLAKPVQP